MDTPRPVDAGATADVSPVNSPAVLIKSNSTAGELVYEAMTHSEKIQKVHDIIRGMHACMLTTRSKDGELRSRPMGVQEAEFNGNLWFFTSRSSRKYDDLHADGRVNLSFCDLKNNNFVTLSGTAGFVEDRQKMRELWKPILKTWFPAGVEDPNLALFMVDCQEAEYWDGPSGVGMALALAKTWVTGNEAALGENERVTLESNGRRT